MEKNSDLNQYIGMIVKSLSGRDKKRIFLVYGVTGSKNDLRLLLTDGKLRTLKGAKVKNPRHVCQIARLSDTEMKQLIDDPRDEIVRRLIAHYDTGGENREMQEEMETHMFGSILIREENRNAEG